MIKKLITLPYKTVSFDQFPMKSGMFPVSSLSDAHLRAPKILLENYEDTFFSSRYSTTIPICADRRPRKLLHYSQAL